MVTTELASTDILAKKRKIQAPRPSDDEKKDESWFLRWQQHQWGLYSNGLCGIGHRGHLPWGRSISVLRAYSRGAQDPTKYMEHQDPADEDGQTLMGISWDTLKLFAKTLDIAKERIMMLDFGVDTRGFDNKLGEKRTRKKARMKGMLDPRIEKLSKFAGLQAGVPGFSSPEDVEDYAQMGLLVLQEEADIKDMIDATEDVSGFETLRSMWIDDLCEASGMATHVKVYGDKVCYNYIDLENVVHRRSKYPDCRDIDFAGYWEEITIDQLRQESDFSEDVLKDIARLAANGTNSTYEAYEGHMREDFYKSRNYNDHKIKVFRSYWVAKEAEDHMEGIYKKNGSSIFKKKPENYEERDYEDVEIKSYSTHYVYKSNMIVGTKYVYGYGRDRHIIREGKPPTALLPIRIWQSDKPSMTERCIPIIDQLQIEWNSIQHFLSKIPPAPRQFWDHALLEEYVSLGGKDRDIKWTVDKFQKTGQFHGRSINEFGDPNGGSNRLPVTPIPMDIAEELATRMNYIQTLKNDLREMTGINEIADGTMNQNDMLVGVADNLDMATNMALGHYVRGWKMFYLDMSKYAVKKWQSVAEYTDVKVGQKSGSVRTVDKNIADYKFDVRIVARLTESDKKQMMQYLFQQKANNLLDEADFFIIYNMIMDGDLKKAQFFIVKSVSRKQKMLQQEKERAIMLQGEQTAKAGVAAEQEKQKTEILKQKGKQQELILKTQGKIKEIKEEGVQERLSIKTKNSLPLSENQPT